MITIILIVSVIVSGLAITNNPNNFIWGDSYERKEQMNYLEEAKYDLMENI